MIRATDAIAMARSLLGTPYKKMDCIGLIVCVIRAAPGGVPGYRTAGTNSLWKSFSTSAKYRDLTWRQEGIAGARAGMLAFKRNGDDVHHVGLVTGEGTVIHASSAKGATIETPLDRSWNLLARHRYIEVAGDEREEEKNLNAYQMQVSLADKDSTVNVRSGPSKNAERIGRLGHGAVVTVLEDFDSGWKRIAYGDSGDGYVDGRFLVPYEEQEPESSDPAITILDSAGNRFTPVGDFRVLIGSVD